MTANTYDFMLLSVGSRGIIYMAALLWMVRFIYLHRPKIRLALLMFFLGMPLLLLGLSLDLWGELSHPMPHPINEVFSKIILTNTGIALVLGALLQLVEELNRISLQHQREAETDPLTGMFNRRVFFAEAERVLDEARVGRSKPAVAIVDVDNMKEVNDKKGHQLGDIALQLVSEAIRNSIRECDVAARYGGDEFIIFFPDKGPHLETLQARLEKNLEAVIVDTGNVPLTLSVGLAQFPADGEHVDELLNVADARMYGSKNAKKQFE